MMHSSAVSAVLFSVGIAAAFAHPKYASLARLSNAQLIAYERSIDVVGAQPLPPPITDTSFKLVYDDAHPYQAAGDGDQRGEL